MPVASATAERSFSVLRCLKNYVRSTMKNDKLSSLGLVHIHRDFVDEMENGAIWGHFRVSYNIESSTILKTDRQEFLKIVQNLPFVS
jgi:hypothetical protein